MDAASQRAFTVPAVLPRAGIVILAGVTFYFFHLRFMPLGVDWHRYFYPFTISWLHGQPVYTLPYHGVFNLPWLATLLAPLTMLGEREAQAAFALVTVSGIAAAWYVFARGVNGLARPLSLALAVANLHVFDLLFRGQIDVYVLIGVALLYVGMTHKQSLAVGAGWLMQLRPTGNVLLLMYSVWFVYQNRMFLRSMLVTLLIWHKLSLNNGFTDTAFVGHQASTLILASVASRWLIDHAEAVSGLVSLSYDLTKSRCHLEATQQCDDRRAYYRHFPLCRSEPGRQFTITNAGKNRCANDTDFEVARRGIYPVAAVI